MMKKNMLFVMLLLLSFYVNGNAQSSVWDGTSSDTGWYDGTKTEYHIATAAQLKGLADLVNNDNQTFEGKDVVLQNNIDLNGKIWTPIGNGYNSGNRVFKGHFKGENHTISNVVINSTTNPYGIAAVSDNYCLGFFGVVKEGGISQLKIEGELTVENGYGCQNAGGLVGYAYNSIIEKVIAKFNLFVKQENGYGLLLGGVAGDATTSSFVSVSSSGEVKYYNNARMRKFFGGISGKAKSLEECSSDFKVALPASGAENCYIGGLSGYAGSITNAIFKGSIDVYDYWNKQKVFVGGITGQSGGNINSVISAPSFFSVQTQMPNLYQGMIVPSTASSSVPTGIYLDGVTNNPGNFGSPITDSELRSSSYIGGFSTDIWVYNRGEYPALKSILEFENTTSVSEATIDTSSSSSTNVIYNLKGQKLPSPQKGINVILKADGTPLKIIVK